MRRPEPAVVVALELRMMLSFEPASSQNAMYPLEVPDELIMLLLELV